MCPRMQRFSPEIQWVLVDPRQNGIDAYCEVCGVGGLQRSSHDVASFAQAHRTHQAPKGSLRLGDAFAAVAKPIARAMGQKPCSPCEARRRAMNDLKRFW